MEYKNGNKDIIKKFHPHPFLDLRFYFLGVVLIILGSFYFWQLIVLGFLLFTFGEILRTAITYYVLESGVARGYNLFSTSRKFAEYENIQNIEVNQSFIEKLLGIGSISFDTSGTDKIEVHFDAIVDPYSVEKIVRQKMIKE